MKKFILGCLLFFMGVANAQNVGINTSGSTPDESAALDIDFDNKGLLIPRMTEAQRDAITSPATALRIFQTDGTTPGFYYYNGTDWVPIFSGWSLTGNDGTSVSANFIGTTDNVGVSFRTNNTERMRIHSGGQVSIGAVTTGSRLDIHQTTGTATSRLINYGNINLLEFRRTGGTIGSPTATSSTNTVLARIDGQGYIGSGTSFTSAARIEMALDAAGGTASDMPGRITFHTTPDESGTLSERMRISNEGYVGINENNPEHMLHITETASSGSIHGLYINESGAGQALVIDEAGNGAGIIVNANDAGSAIISSSDGAVTTSVGSHIFNDLRTSSTADILKIDVDINSVGIWNGVDAQNIGLRVNARGGTTNFPALFSGGNVGIGTYNPRATLDVVDSLATSPVIISSFYTPLMPDEGKSYIKLGKDGFTTRNAADIFYHHEADGSYENFLAFSFVGEAERLTIKANGNVGVGTNNPLQDFSVVSNGTEFDRGGHIHQYSSTTHAAHLGLRKARGTEDSPLAVAANDALSVITFSGYDGSDWIWGSAISANVGGPVSSGTLPMDLLFYTSETNTPVERMRITNSGRVGIGENAPGGQFELSLDQGRKPSTTTWTTTSDGRLKDITGTYDKGLEEVLQLNPVRYHYKDVRERTFEDEVKNTESIGFVAQEVQTIFPETVGTDDDGYLNFNMHAILVAYVNAIKELNAENQALKERIEKLEATDVEELKKELETLKALVLELMKK